MNHQTQDDFDCLHIAISKHSSSTHTLVDHDAVLSGKAAKSTGSEKSTCNDEAYVPVNFIEPEVYAMIAAWEACELKGRASEASSECSLDARQDAVCEPSRCVSITAPPKRFYRAFWRSTTRRMLEQARKSIHSSQSSRLEEIEGLGNVIS